MSLGLIFERQSFVPMLFRLHDDVLKLAKGVLRFLKKISDLRLCDFKKIQLYFYCPFTAGSPIWKKSIFSDEDDNTKCLPSFCEQRMPRRILLLGLLSCITPVLPIVSLPS